MNENSLRVNELFDLDLALDSQAINHTDVLELPREIYQSFKKAWHEVFGHEFTSSPPKPPTSVELKRWWKNWYSPSFDDWVWYEEKWENTIRNKEVTSPSAVEHDQHDLVFYFCSEYLDNTGGKAIYGAFIEFVSKFVFNGKLVDLSSLNPFSLRSIPIDDRDELPEESGIYFVIDSSNVYYIGISKDLNRRWYSHHRQDDFDKIPGLMIAYVDCLPQHYLRSIESVLIEHFTPRLNIQGNPLIKIQ